MDDSSARLRKHIQEAQARDSLRAFASSCEEADFERALVEFNNRVAAAFNEVSKVFVAEGVKMEKLERDYEPGFSVEDLPGTTFMFWIELHGKGPVAQARRRAGSARTSAVVSTLGWPPDLHDTTQADIVNGILYAYEKSQFGR